MKKIIIFSIFTILMLGAFNELALAEIEEKEIRNSK